MSYNETVLKNLLRSIPQKGKVEWIGIRSKKKEELSGKTDTDFRLHAQEKLRIGLFPELVNPSGIGKNDAFARGTHLQPIIENIQSPEPIEPYLVQTSELDLQAKLQNSESILGSRILRSELDKEKQTKS